MRRVTERLEGYAFAVAPQPTPPDGLAPDEIAAEVVFIDDPNNPAHTIVVPLTASGKRALIAQLTGGLLVG
jgi:hypothetical protein